MKALQHSFLLFIIVCLLIPTTIHSQSLDEELPRLINLGDFLSLARRYEMAKDSVELDVVKRLSEGFIQSAFNRPKEASDTFLDLANNYQDNLGVSGIVSMVLMMTANMHYMGNYETAATLSQSFLDQTVGFEGVDSLHLESLAHQVPLGVFGDSYSPELIRPNRDTEVPLISGEGVLESHLYIPVTINGKEKSFIFDTGMDGYSTNFVSNSFAIENGIRILDDSVIVNGVAARSYAKLGVLDSMKIGDIVYKNVAFTIAPDNDFISQYVDAVLGLTFIKAVGEIQIYPQEKKIVFPIQQSAPPVYAPNMMFVNGQPYLESYVNDERLLLHFDTGSGISLNSGYYEKHKETIEAVGRLRTEGGIGGVGGLRMVPQYYMPELNIRVGNVSKEAKEVMVLTEDVNNNAWSAGSIGSDFVRLHNKVTINFNRMFVAVE